MEKKDTSPRQAQEGGQGGVDPTRPDLAAVHAERQPMDAKAAPTPRDGLSMGSRDRFGDGADGALAGA